MHFPVCPLPVEGCHLSLPPCTYLGDRPGDTVSGHVCHGVILGSPVGCGGAAMRRERAWLQQVAHRRHSTAMGEHRHPLCTPATITQPVCGVTPTAGPTPSPHVPVLVPLSMVSVSAAPFLVVPVCVLCVVVLCLSWDQCILHLSLGWHIPCCHGTGTVAISMQAAGVSPLYLFSILFYFPTSAFQDTMGSGVGNTCACPSLCCANGKDLRMGCATVLYKKAYDIGSILPAALILCVCVLLLLFELH